MNRALLSGTQNAEVLPYLQRSPLFADLDADQLGTVIDHTRFMELPPGETLFEQSQAARDFFMLTSGQVKLTRSSPDGHEKIIDLISPGNTFAEAILFSGQRAYPVSASALVASEVLCFDIATYADILHQSTEACFAVLAQMSRRLHWYIGEIDRLTLHGATFRVVSYLLDQVPSTHLGSSRIFLTTPKHAIASRLSITPETLSRSFSKLSRDGLIEVEDDAIVIKDVGRLRQYAQGSSH
ncbi:MAG TPA: Crp/Fnr family transcriptional regulator [Gammaproteobacteria bacterium]|nr:Crp/Fnr family transcriptional regulator [Gammaproteobacteria bacterium]